jgi:hypothetical protein
MTVKIANCEKCGRLDMTSIMACAPGCPRLCPECFPMDIEGMVRKDFSRQLHAYIVANTPYLADDERKHVLDHLAYGRVNSDDIGGQGCINCGIVFSKIRAHGAAQPEKPEEQLSIEMVEATDCIPETKQPTRGDMCVCGHSGWEHQIYTNKDGCQVSGCECVQFKKSEPEQLYQCPIGQTCKELTCRKVGIDHSIPHKHSNQCEKPYVCAGNGQVILACQPVPPEREIKLTDCALNVTNQEIDGTLYAVREGACKQLAWDSAEANRQLKDILAAERANLDKVRARRNAWKQRWLATEKERAQAQADCDALRETDLTQAQAKFLGDLSWCGGCHREMATPGGLDCGDTCMPGLADKLAKRAARP